MFCAIQNLDGSYQIEQIINPADCSGLLMTEGADLSHWIRFLIDPAFFTTAQYEQVFLLGLSLPLISYLTAWGYQQIIKFIEEK